MLSPEIPETEYVDGVSLTDVIPKTPNSADAKKNDISETSLDLL